MGFLIFLICVDLINWKFGCSEFKQFAFYRKHLSSVYLCSFMFNFFIQRRIKYQIKIFFIRFTVGKINYNEIEIMDILDILDLFISLLYTIYLNTSCRRETFCSHNQRMLLMNLHDAIELEFHQSSSCIRHLFLLVQRCFSMKFYALCYTFVHTQFLVAFHA